MFVILIKLLIENVNLLNTVHKITGSDKDASPKMRKLYFLNGNEPEFEIRVRRYEKLVQLTRDTIQL